MGWRQGLMDGDFKEMQLHMDRLFIQNQMERDRHEQEIAELCTEHAKQRAEDEQQHQANLKAMQLATLEQRELQAQEVSMCNASLTVFH
jgi:hypothetical protein